MQSDLYLKRYLSRKFLLAVLSVLSATILVYFAKISDGVYSSVVIAAIGAYTAGNIFQKNLELKD